MLQHERKVSYGNFGPQELVRFKKLAKGRDFYRTVRMREDKKEFWTWDLVLSGFYEHRRTGKITYSNETMVDQIKDKCHDPRTCVSDRKRKLRCDLVFGKEQNMSSIGKRTIGNVQLFYFEQCAT